MNRENVEKLRDFLRDEVSDKKFRMDEFDCGTAACIAGWGERLFGKEPHWFGPEAQEVEEGSAYRRLVMPDGWSQRRTSKRYTRTRAVDTLTRLLETGEVDWGSE